MKYIVWKPPFKSYGKYDQGDGYFVKYKDKCSDTFSPNWFDANKYNSIVHALKRLGIDFLFKSLDEFYKLNPIDKSVKRDNIISEILDEYKNKSLFFEIGHIDKIDDNGNFIGNAGEEILEYIENLIAENSKKSKSLQKKFEKLEKEFESKNYIDTSISDDEFWKEILK